MRLNEHARHIALIAIINDRHWRHVAIGDGQRRTNQNDLSAEKFIWQDRHELRGEGWKGQAFRVRARAPRNLDGRKWRRATKERDGLPNKASRVTGRVHHAAIFQFATRIDPADQCIKWIRQQICLCPLICRNKIIEKGQLFRGHNIWGRGVTYKKRCRRRRQDLLETCVLCGLCRLVDDNVDADYPCSLCRHLADNIGQKATVNRRAIREGGQRIFIDRDHHNVI